jgi:hypothetical protein
MRSTIPATSKPGRRASSPAHEVYMRVTCLEMERARRSVERAAAAQRIEEIDRRILLIDREKTDLLDRLARTKSKPDEAAAAAAGAFRIRY